MARARDLIAQTALVALTVLLVIGLVRLLVQITAILLLLLISVILAAGISPLTAAIQRRRFGRRQRQISQPAAILLVYLGLILLLFLMAGIILTPLVTETRDFIAALPQIMQNLEQSAAALEGRYEWLPDLSVIVSRLPQELAGLSRYFGTAAGVAFRALGGVVSIVTVLFMTYYMLVEGQQMKRGFLTLFPRERRDQVEEILQRIGLKFGGWLRGQLLLGLIIGVVVGLGAVALRLPYPLLLGLIAGITELIPIVGPILGAIPAALIALFQPPWWRVLVVAGFYALVQQLESNFVVPRVMRLSVGLSPLLTVVALLIGAKLLGIAGALLAVPVAAALQVVVGEVLAAVREVARRT
ncbi:MAG: AI-2E family transporter [Armatimonadetes bacterium]|nr:AI-2E family transporter [Armatimonadota bacterium]